MTLELALLALSALADPANRAHPWEVHAIVAEADRASRRHGLPVGLLVAVVLAESGGRNIISRRRRCGGRDAGYYQVHTHAAVHVLRFRRLLSLEVNTDRGASILASSKARCARHPRWAACKRSSFALYNTNSETWAPRVLRIWRRLLERVRGNGGGLST